MSYKNNQNLFIHPFTFFLVNKIELMFELVNDLKYMKAVRAMDWFIINLDPEIQEVLEEKGIVKTIHDWVTKQSTHSMDYNKLKETFKDVYVSLHIAGYFSQAKYGPTTKISQLSTLKEKLQTAILKQKVKKKRKEREQNVN